MVEGILFGRIDFSLWGMHGIQALSFVLTIALFTFHIYRSKGDKLLNRITLAFTMAAIAAHFYETFHAAFELLSTGTTGNSIIFNILILGALAFFWRSMYRYSLSKLWVAMLILFVLSFVYLGFFTDFYLTTSTKTYPWALTKITGYTLWTLPERKSK